MTPNQVEALLSDYDGDREALCGLPRKHIIFLHFMRDAISMVPAAENRVMIHKRS